MVEWERWGTGSRIVKRYVHQVVPWHECEHLKLSPESLGWAPDYFNFCHSNWVSKPRTLLRVQPKFKWTKVVCGRIFSGQVLKPWWKFEELTFDIDWALEFPVEMTKQTVFSGKSSLFEVPDNRMVGKIQPAPISSISGRAIGPWVALPPHVLKVGCFKGCDHWILNIVAANSLIIRDVGDRYSRLITRSSLERGGNSHCW